MSDSTNPEPKDRILQAAATLIAAKGFSAIGVREIAANANVNISMISYYFGSKVGILKAIIEEYFIGLKKIIQNVLKEKLSPEEQARRYIELLIDRIREKPELCKVALIEMPFNTPEIAEFKVNMLKQHVHFAKENFNTVYPEMKDHRLHKIIGPAMISLVFSHFLVGDVSGKALNVAYNDDFYDLYKKTIGTIFLKGVIGLAEESKKTNNK